MIGPRFFSTPLSTPLELFCLELFGGDGHRTDRQNRDRVKVKAAEYPTKWIYIHLSKD